MKSTPGIIMKKLDRRSFVKTSLAGGAFASVLPGTASSPARVKEHAVKPSLCYLQASLPESMPCYKDRGFEFQNIFQ